MTKKTRCDACVCERNVTTPDEVGIEVGIGRTGLRSDGDVGRPGMAGEAWRGIISNPIVLWRG